MMILWPGSFIVMIVPAVLVIQLTSSEYWLLKNYIHMENHRHSPKIIVFCTISQKYQKQHSSEQIKVVWTCDADERREDT
jgi:hypothetical protein